jgi:iron(III) transport system permease protein
MTGKFTRRELDLGRWRWPAFALVLGVVLLLAVVPLGLVMMGASMKRFGFFDVPRPWTLEHWQDGFDHPQLFQALENTLLLGTAAAVVSMALFSLIAYFSARTTFRGRGLLDFLTWLPTALSGIIVSLGFLWLFLSTPVLRTLYGTIWILVFAIVLSGITLGVQVIKTNMLQVGVELEEASRVTGASWLRTFVKVVLPPIAPAIAVVGVLIFTLAARATAPISLLTVRSTEPLSMIQLYEMADGSLEYAAIIGLIVVVLTAGVGLVARALGMRSLGLER